MEEQVKNKLLQNMTDNLPTLRAKLGISQEKTAQMLGVSRSTVTSIENHKRPMSWSLFLSLMMIFTSNEETKKLLVPLGIYNDELGDFVQNRLTSTRNSVIISLTNQNLQRSFAICRHRKNSEKRLPNLQ